MKLLSTYTPAESILIAQGEKAALKELLQFTFLDLVLKDVLRVIQLPMKQDASKEVRMHRYVTTGSRFLTYTPLAHEEIFLQIYQKDAHVQILYRHMIKIAYQKAITENYYQSKIRKSLRIQSFFTRTFFQKMFGGFNWSAEGAMQRKKLRLEIDQCEHRLQTALNEDVQRARELVGTIHGNVFLLQQIDFSFLTQIDAELLQTMKPTKEGSDDYAGGTGCSGCSWDSSHHGGDSGCGGGDSGCGGCGGGD